jgi:hypothetical protein
MRSAEGKVVDGTDSVVDRYSNATEAEYVRSAALC